MRLHTQMPSCSMCRSAIKVYRRRLCVSSVGGQNCRYVVFFLVEGLKFWIHQLSGTDVVWADANFSILADANRNNDDVQQV